MATVFDQPDEAEVQPRRPLRFAGNRTERAVRALRPKLIAIGGLGLFAGGLFVAFRVVALDAARQLRQPAVDFAFCGAIALLGLSISWVYLGDNSPLEIEDIANQSTEIALEEFFPHPLCTALLNPSPLLLLFPLLALTRPLLLRQSATEVGLKYARIVPRRWRDWDLPAGAAKSVAT